MGGDRSVPAAWKAKHPSVSGHQGRYELREIVNAIFYQNRTGCQWAYLPHDLPPKSATYYYFALWRDDGTDQAIHDLLRCQAREKAGRAEDPTAVVLDTQSIRAANHVPAATTGKDAAKKGAGPQAGPGRGRARADHRGGGHGRVGHRQPDRRPLLDRVVAHTPTVTKAWVDAGFKDDVAIHGAVHGIDVEQVKRSDTRPGFVPVAKRWIVEQTNGTLMLHRRLVREYETRPGLQRVTHLVGVHGEPGPPADRHHHTDLAHRHTVNHDTDPGPDHRPRNRRRRPAAEQLREQIATLAAAADRVDDRAGRPGDHPHHAAAPGRPPRPGDADGRHRGQPRLPADPRRLRRHRHTVTRQGHLPRARHRHRRQDTESLRAKLKRLVARGVLTEPEPGLFALAQPATSNPDPTPEP